MLNFRREIRSIHTQNYSNSHIDANYGFGEPLSFARQMPAESDSGGLINQAGEARWKGLFRRRSWYPEARATAWLYFACLCLVNRWVINPDPGGGGEGAIQG